MDNFKHDFIQIGNIKIHVASENSDLKGDNMDSTPFLLIHGFPECWYSYRYLIPLLANPPNSKKRFKSMRWIYGDIISLQNSWV